MDSPNKDGKLLDVGKEIDKVSGNDEDEDDEDEFDGDEFDGDEFASSCLASLSVESTTFLLFSLSCFVLN